MDICAGGMYPKTSNNTALADHPPYSGLQQQVFQKLQQTLEEAGVSVIGEGSLALDITEDGNIKVVGNIENKEEVEQALNENDELKALLGEALTSDSEPGNLLTAANGKALHNVDTVSLSSGYQLTSTGDILYIGSSEFYNPESAAFNQSKYQMELMNLQLPRQDNAAIREHVANNRGLDLFTNMFGEDDIRDRFFSGTPFSPCEFNSMQERDELYDYVMGKLDEAGIDRSLARHISLNVSWETGEDGQENKVIHIDGNGSLALNFSDEDRQALESVLKNDEYLIGALRDARSSNPFYQGCMTIDAHCTPKEKAALLEKLQAQRDVDEAAWNEYNAQRKEIYESHFGPVPTDPDRTIPEHAGYDENGFSIEAPDNPNSIGGRDLVFGNFSFDSYQRRQAMFGGLNSTITSNFSEITSIAGLSFKIDNYTPEHSDDSSANYIRIMGIHDEELRNAVEEKINENYYHRGNLADFYDPIMSGSGSGLTFESDEMPEDLKMYSPVTERNAEQVYKMRKDYLEEHPECSKNQEISGIGTEELEDSTAPSFSRMLGDLFGLKNFKGDLQDLGESIKRKLDTLQEEMTGKVNAILEENEITLENGETLEFSVDPDGKLEVSGIDDETKLAKIEQALSEDETFVNDLKTVAAGKEVMSKIGDPKFNSMEDLSKETLTTLADNLLSSYGMSQKDIDTFKATGELPQGMELESWLTNSDGTFAIDTSGEKTTTKLSFGNGVFFDQQAMKTAADLTDRMYIESNSEMYNDLARSGADAPTPERDFICINHPMVNTLSEAVALWNDMADEEDQIRQFSFVLNEELGRIEVEGDEDMSKATLEMIESWLNPTDELSEFFDVTSNITQTLLDQHQMEHGDVDQYKHVVKFNIDWQKGVSTEILSPEADEAAKKELEENLDSINKDFNEYVDETFTEQTGEGIKGDLELQVDNYGKLHLSEGSITMLNSAQLKQVEGMIDLINQGIEEAHLKTKGKEGPVEEEEDTTNVSLNGENVEVPVEDADDMLKVIKHKHQQDIEESLAENKGDDDKAAKKDEEKDVALSSFSQLEKRGGIMSILPDKLQGIVTKAADLVDILDKFHDEDLRKSLTWSFL